MTEKHNSSHNELHFGDCGEKNLINWKKPLTEPDLVWTAICLEQYILPIMEMVSPHWL